MGADGSWLWRRAGKMLLDAGIYTEADYLALELMCTAWDRMKQAERLMAVDGMQLTTNGGSYLNPYVAIANRSWKQVKAMLKEFGLTPAESLVLFRG
jgi:P27 family predicted phage terminase small subunit